MIKKIKHLKGMGKLVESLTELEYLEPEKVFIQLETPRCKSLTLTVKEGDHVSAQQIIGVRDCGFYKENIITTVSGTVQKEEKRFTSMGKIARTLPILNDMQHEYDARVKDLSDEEVFNLSKEEIFKAIDENCVQGMGGAGFPTSIKLQPKDPVHTLVVNAVECEPGTKADFSLMVKEPDLALKGLKLAMKATGITKAVIGIKKTKVKAVESMKEAIKKYPELNITIAELEDFYPQGWEVEVIRKACGVDVQGMLPSAKGFVQINVNTLRAIYLACAKNQTVDYLYMVVSGEVNSPSLIKTRIGAPVLDLINLAGGYKGEENKVVVLGGPMMGRNILMENAITNQLTSSVLVFNDYEEKEENCVHCASCVKSCPAGLAPVQIMNKVKANDKDGLMKLNVNACVECGLCTYVCTSQIHVTDYIRKAKTMIKK